MDEWMFWAQVGMVAFNAGMALVNFTLWRQASSPP